MFLPKSQTKIPNVFRTKFHVFLIHMKELTLIAELLLETAFLLSPAGLVFTTITLNALCLVGISAVSVYTESCQRRKKKGRKKEREDGSEKTDDCDHKSSAVLLVCFTADIRRLCWVFWCLYYLAHTFCSIWSLLGNGFHHTGWVWTPSISHLFHLSFEDPVGNGSQSLQSHSEIHYHNILGFLWFIV